MGGKHILGKENIKFRKTKGAGTGSSVWLCVLVKGDELEM